MGVPFVEDFNDPKQPASSITKLRTTVTAQGKRSSTSDAFLSDKEVRIKRNLNICFGAVVQRLHLDDQNRVQGVFVETELPSTETFYISVEKEVIVCGGAVASPQILLLRLSLEFPPNLSGIGPKGQLANHNITCNVDLPGVGSHLVIALSFSF
jgi:choline dehydrogenase